MHVTCAALSVCVLAASAYAAPLARIEGVEDKSLREALKEIIAETDEEGEARWRERERAQRAAERIRRYLRSRGYYAALVDPRLSPEGKAEVRVRAGAQFTFSSLEVEFLTPEGARVPGKDISEHLDLEDGAPVLAREVIEAERRVLDQLRNNGWIYAQTGNREVIVDHATNSARAIFRYETGAFVRFGRPQLAGGLAELEEDYVAELRPYEIGEPASQAKIDEYASRLQNLDIVSIADVRVAPDAGSLQRPVDLRMEPRERHTIALSARWSTDEGFGGEAEWTRRNIFHRDGTLEIDLRAATLESGLETRLDLPHWQKYNQLLSLRAAALAERTDAFDQDSVSASARISRVYNDRLTASIGVEGQAARVEDARGERDLYTVSLPGDAVYDTRTDILNPREGYYASLGLRPAYSFGDEQTFFLRTVGELRGYIPASEEIVLAGRVRLGGLIGSDAASVPADLRFFAGGGGSVRGYEYQSISPPLLNPVTGAQEPFGGRSLLESSVEARWKFRERFGVVGFADAGVSGPNLAPDLGEVQYAAGIGVRYYPGFGPIRADIATPLNPRESDDRIHIYISIGQAF